MNVRIPADGRVHFVHPLDNLLVAYCYLRIFFRKRCDTALLLFLIEGAILSLDYITLFYKTLELLSAFILFALL